MAAARRWGLGTILIAVGAAVGGGVMLAVMFQMMLAMQDMRGAMAAMAGDMRAMRGHMANMDTGIGGMGGDMQSMAIISREITEIDAHMLGMYKLMERDLDVIAGQITEIDSHMLGMYELMAQDLDEIRQGVQTMAPSVATMGPNMEVMRHDMHRGVGSFSSPGGYVRNMFR